MAICVEKRILFYIFVPSWVIVLSAIRFVYSDEIL